MPKRGIKNIPARSDPAVAPKDRPGWHSALYLPVAEPALRTGMLAMSSAVLSLLKK